jgi:D-alanyl-D-alanine dipeptidase/CubicO group peptidase (beta-lactamase class C family)
MRSLTATLALTTALACFAPALTPVWAQAAAQASSALPTSVAALAEAEIADKALPSLALAVVDSAGRVQASAWGQSDRAAKTAATADALYRAGGLAGPLTRLVALDLARAGKLDLSAPVTRYLPDFKPKSRFKAVVRVRDLIDDRSGLVAEPPVGGAYDEQARDLTAIVASLNTTSLTVAPGTVRRASHAASAVLGRVLETVEGSSYAEVMRKRLFAPLGMTATVAVAADGARLADAELASFDSARIAAPDARLGAAPAVGLVTSAADLGRLAGRLRGENPVVLARLGFASTTVAGRAAWRLDGAAPASSLAIIVLPTEKRAAIAVGTVEQAAAPGRLAEQALTQGASVRSVAIKGAEADKLWGWYVGPSGSAYVHPLEGKLFVETPRLAGELRRAGGGVVLDDLQHFRTDVSLDAAGQVLTVGKDSFRRAVRTRPADVSASLGGLLGDYGPENDYLRLYERDGRAYARTHAVDYTPLVAIDANTLAFPADAPRHAGERIVFTRDAKGEAIGATLGGSVLARHDFGAELEDKVGGLLKVTPEVIAEAKAATPPVNPAGLKAPELVQLISIDPKLKLDIRYAGTNNFVHTPVYPAAIAMMQRPAAEAVARADAALRKDGFGLLIHDGYRPWYVTKIFWDSAPPEGKIFVADPSRGSRHNRGAAVDLTMYDLKTGEPMVTTGRYDEMSSRSYPFYVGGTSLQRWKRDLLRRAMTDQGFDVYEFEWWHFDYRSWASYPVMNVDLTDAAK